MLQVEPRYRPWYCSLRMLLSLDNKPMFICVRNCSLHTCLRSSTFDSDQNFRFRRRNARSRYNVTPGQAFVDLSKICAAAAVGCEPSRVEMMQTTETSVFNPPRAHSATSSSSTSWVSNLTCLEACTARTCTKSFVVQLHTGVPMRWQLWGIRYS